MATLRFAAIAALSLVFAFSIGPVQADPSLDPEVASMMERECSGAIDQRCSHFHCEYFDDGSCGPHIYLCIYYIGGADAHNPWILDADGDPCVHTIPVDGVDGHAHHSH